MRKPNIYINVSENSGVGYYRQFLPAVALREQGLANVLINDFTWGENRLFCKNFGNECEFIVAGTFAEAIVDEFVIHLKKVHKKDSTDADRAIYHQGLIYLVEPTVETLNKIGHWADIIVFGRRDVPEYLSQWKGISEFFNIPTVLDTDDNVAATRPFNPGYRGYRPGGQALYWNKETARTVDAITVSTENLKKVHERDNKNIYVLPNCLELQRWNTLKTKHPEIRIGLLLSAAHHEDAALLKKVIPIVLRKYPNAHFYFTNMFGYHFEEIQKELPKQVFPIP